MAKCNGNHDQAQLGDFLWVKTTGSLYKMSDPTGTGRTAVIRFIHSNFEYENIIEIKTSNSPIPAKVRAHMPLCKYAHVLSAQIYILYQRLNSVCVCVNTETKDPHMSLSRKKISRIPAPVARYLWFQTAECRVGFVDCSWSVQAH